MSSKVRAALDEIGHPNLYQVLRDEGMDDETFSLGFEDDSLVDRFQKYFPQLDHFNRFKQVFQRLTQQRERLKASLNPPGTNTPLPDLHVTPGYLLDPVQIIDFIAKGKSDGQSKLVLQESKLGRIVSQVGSRPVSLLIVAGPSRQGKSFILSYMIKYLRTISTNEDAADWMGSAGTRRHEPLEGGFSWRNGVERETVGIYMWPEPFTLTSSDGHEFDVLLVDTQGVFDHYTDKKDWATIVGLSLLTSSCLIFNISKTLQEDSLESLKEFMDFGLLACDTDRGDEKPFQNLMFLIRDWNNGSEYSFGAEGGAKFLNYCLAQSHTKSGENIRNQIRQCFESLDCFLMPDPGETVKDVNYDGAVAGMSVNFVRQLQNFLKHVSHPGKLAIKKIADSLVTGDDLVTYFKKYVEIFNSDELPTSEAMNRAMVEICNQTVLNKCVTLYKTEFQLLRQNVARSFLLDAEIGSCHSAASERALTLYDASKTLGDTFENKTSRNKLSDALMENLLELFTLQNQETKEQTIKNEVNTLKSNLTDTLESGIQESCAEQDNFVTRTELAEIVERCGNAAVSKLCQNLGIPNTDAIASHKQHISSQVAQVIKSTENQNEINTKDAEAALREAVGRFTELLKKTMQSLTHHRYTTPSEFELFFKTASIEAHAPFAEKFEKSSLYEHGCQLLEAASSELHSRFLKSTETFAEKHLLECRQSLNQILKTYRERLLANLKRSSFSQSHADAVAHCTQIFENLFCVQSLPEAEKLKLEGELSLEAKTRRKEIAQQHAQELMQKLLKQFKETLATTTAVSEDALRREMSQVRNKFEATWSDICSVAALDETAKTEFNSDLEAELKNHVDYLAIKAASGKLKQELKLKSDVKMSVKNFEKLLKLVSTASKTEMDLREKADEAMTWELESFEAKYEACESVSMQPVLSELRSELNASLVAEIKIFDLHLKQLAAGEKLAEEKRKAEAEIVRQEKLREEENLRHEMEVRERADAVKAEYEQLRREEQEKLKVMEEKRTQQHNAQMESMRKDGEARETRIKEETREQANALATKLEELRRESEARAAAELRKIEQRNEQLEQKVREEKERADREVERRLEAARRHQRAMAMAMDSDSDDSCHIS